MTQKQLQQLLQQPYTTENWKQLLQYVFKNVQLLEDPPQIPINDDRVKSFKQYGSVKLSDGKILALFELNLHDNVNLIRNRVGLNDIVSRYIDQETTHGVLSIFEQGTEDYRFTFTAHSTEFDEEEQDFIERKTDTKRFTYILGKNESCRTAAQRFEELSAHKETADMTAVERAFSVEKLSKLFFKEYTEQFAKLVAYLKSKPGYYQEIFEKEESSARNFVKIFLGRLVFIKFVEKKGWLGVPPKETGWKNGNYKFLQQEYNKYKHKDQFLSGFLNPLFFDALNTGARDNDIFPLTGTKIPHLSGGLFENENPKTLRIDFPEELLTGLFDFFDRYNFTIDENDVHDKEVGIDPEMLGHIFENLLEDNKDKGAFYTPKEIVRYMCQESLKEYLKTYFQKESLWPSEDDTIKELEEILSRFVEKKEVSKVLHLDKPLARALRDVKICDPAIGSGAFPMGLLNEIFRLVKILHDESPDRVGAVWGMLGDNWEAGKVKLNIIENSIYGVDIEPGAVDIARLRFWLSLVIEEETPHPLPHLNYKIVVGNSLASILDNTVIDIEWDVNNQNSQTNIFGNSHAERTNKIVKEISKLQKEVFQPESDEHKLSLLIRNKKIDLLISQLEFLIETKGLKEKPSSSGQRLERQMEIWVQTQEWKKQIKNLEQLKVKSFNELVYFDWKLDFPEIMNEEINSGSGFDIVIGNPPYIGEKGNEHIFQTVLKTGLGQRFYTRWMDYFYFFFHKGLDLVKENGVVNLITTNYYFTSTGGDNLRMDLKNRSNIKVLINLNDLKIFPSALGQHNAITFLKKNNSPVELAKTINVKAKGLISPEVMKKILEEKNTLSDHYLLKQEELYEGRENYIRPAGLGKLDGIDLTITDVLLRLKNNSSLLGDITNITMGVVTLSDTVSASHLKKFNGTYSKGEGIYILTDEEVAGLKLTEAEKEIYIKPLYKNSEIKPFTSNYQNKLWLIYIKDKGQPIDLPEGLKKHFERFKPLVKGLKDNFLKNAIAASIVKKWYANGNYFVLFTPKKESYFKGEKIVAPYRSKTNIFSYCPKPFYGSKDIAYILPKDHNFSLKYLTCLLNSKLIYNWLYFKGKRKGETLELYKKPLSTIPIKNAGNQIQNKFISLFDDISNNQQICKDQYDRLNLLCYKLYNLSYSEALVIEPELNERITEESYNSFTLELEEAFIDK